MLKKGEEGSGRLGLEVVGKGKLETADWKRPLDGMGLRSTLGFPWKVLSGSVNKE